MYFLQNSSFPAAALFLPTGLFIRLLFHEMPEVKKQK